MAMIGYIIFGFFVGVLAKLIMPGRDPGGLIVTTLLGMAGAFVGGWLGQAMWGVGYQAGWIMAIAGSLLLLGLYRAVAGRRAAGI